MLYERTMAKSQLPVGIVRLNVCGICGQLLHPLFVSYFLSIFWIFQTFWIFYHKSSDLSMVNPHYFIKSVKSQDLWCNPQIQRGFLLCNPWISWISWQSSDLVEDLSKSSNGSEDFIYFVWILVCHSIEDAFYTTSPLTD